MEDIQTNTEKREAPTEKIGTGVLLHDSKSFDTEEDISEVKSAFALMHKGLDVIPELDMSRVLTFMATDETPDRAGDIMRVDGGDVKNFLRNPVFLKQHDRDEACGRVLSFKKVKNLAGSPEGKAWIAKVYFPEEVEDADEIFLKYKHGILSAVSIGFNATLVNRPADPVERKKLGIGEWGYEILKWELYELSGVSVPCNPNALAIKSAPIASKAFEQLTGMVLSLADTVKKLRETIKSIPEEKEPKQSETVSDLVKQLEATPIKF